MTQMLTVLAGNQEWMYLSVDATVKTCLKLCGQESYRSSKKARNAAPFGDDVALRRLLTVRGRTGAVLLIHPIVGETAHCIVEAFSKHFTSQALAQVRYVASDAPSGRLHTALQQACPSLQCVALDPIHLAIVYEYAQWHKRTVGSRWLRTLLTKAPC
jgi:hypothetical protein